MTNRPNMKATNSTKIVIGRLVLVATIGLALISNSQAGQGGASTQNGIPPTPSGALKLVPPDTVSAAGTFWLLSGQSLAPGQTPDAPSAPYPFDPYDGRLPIYSFDPSEHIYLVADSAKDYAELQSENAAKAALAGSTPSGPQPMGDGPNPLDPSQGPWLTISLQGQSVTVVMTNLTVGNNYALVAAADVLTAGRADILPYSTSVYAVGPSGNYLPLGTFEFTNVCDVIDSFTATDTSRTNIVPIASDSLFFNIRGLDFYEPTPRIVSPANGQFFSDTIPIALGGPASDGPAQTALDCWTFPAGPVQLLFFSQTTQGVPTDYGDVGFSSAQSVFVTNGPAFYLSDARPSEVYSGSTDFTIAVVDPDYNNANYVMQAFDESGNLLEALQGQFSAGSGYIQYLFTSNGISIDPTGQMLMFQMSATGASKRSTNVTIRTINSPHVKGECLSYYHQWPWSVLGVSETDVKNTMSYVNDSIYNAALFNYHGTPSDRTPWQYWTYYPGTFEVKFTSQTNDIATLKSVLTYPFSPLSIFGIGDYAFVGHGAPDQIIADYSHIWVPLYAKDLQSIRNNKRTGKWVTRPDGTTIRVEKYRLDGPFHTFQNWGCFTVSDDWITASGQAPIDYVNSPHQDTVVYAGLQGFGTLNSDFNQFVRDLNARVVTLGLPFSVALGQAISLHPNVDGNPGAAGNPQTVWGN